MSKSDRMDDTPPASESPVGIPAATVIVFRRDPDQGADQLLMMVRAESMRFAPGATVFPGGRIDPADRLLAARGAPHFAEPDASARVAAIRETLEEAGLVLGVREKISAPQAAEARAMLASHGDLAPVLDHFGWTLDVDQLVPFSRWCPRFEPAFDTRFYLADIGTGAVDISPDGTENSRLYWSSAAATLAMLGAGDVSALFPTWRNLERLAQHTRFEAARADALRFPPALIRPWVEARDGTRCMVIPEQLGYPVTTHPLD